MKHRFLVLLAAGTLTPAWEGIALEPSAAQSAPLQRRPAPQRPANVGGPNPGTPSTTGEDRGFAGTGFFDPTSSNVKWNGKSWDVADSALFASRFEQYLNASPVTDEAAKEYQAYLQQIIFKLSPGSVTHSSSDEAFQLLERASDCPQDTNICDSIASQVCSARNSYNKIEQLRATGKVLEGELKRLEWNAQITARSNELELIESEKHFGGGIEIQSITARIAEVKRRIRSNQLKREVAELRVRIEFQALIMQHFFQRRFQHVVIGIRFYRSIFRDGDGRLRLARNVKNLFSRLSSRSPTLNTVDSLSNELMAHVRQSMQAFKFLLKKNELASATKRLSEAFMIGEHLPEIGTLNRADRQRVLAFLQMKNQLANAIEAKDFALARNLVAELGQIARDFDVSKPLAAIETARQISAVHIAKARDASVSGDKETLETELKAALELWPRNPALAEVTKMIFSQADIQSRALVDFDQLISGKHYRRIFEDKMRFIAATATHPEKRRRLSEVLDDMQAVETSITRAQETEKRGDYAGAWENAERAFRDFPNDNKLNRVRADLTTKAVDFVHAIRQAEELEQKHEYGSSFAWYLQARRKYPESEFARQGIDRLTRQILPDAN